MSIDFRARIVIAHQLAVSLAQVTDRALIRDELGADSLDVAALHNALEREFGIVVTDDEAEELESVGAVIDFLERKLASSSQQLTERVHSDG